MQRINLTPLVLVKEEHISDIKGVHNKQQETGLIDIPNVVPKNEDKGQDSRGEAQPDLLDIHLRHEMKANYSSYTLAFFACKSTGKITNATSRSLAITIHFILIKCL